ncbi:MAG: hydroxymethylpyrimidine/phosphomethylpyrimidine kinase [Verrucomicrobiota bacterium]
MSASIPVALTIAGSDSSAGAGIQADLKTFSALGVYGLTAITSVVAETPGVVSKILPLSPEIVREQIEVLLESFPIAAIKTGLLVSSEIVAEVARGLRAQTTNGQTSVPLVIDPVMVATSGDSLLRDEALQTYESELIPLATLVTPNLSEAGRFLGEPVRDLAEMRKAGEILVKKYGVPFLLKGGHLTGDAAIDLLFVEGNVIEFSAPFSRGVATHGTGCTFSAAITAGLASGLLLEEAVRRAKNFVSATIAGHYAWGDIHALNHSPSTW